jgi:adenylate cyclase
VDAEAILAEYGQGFRNYREHAFGEALASFERVLQAWPTDGPSRVLRDRALRYAAEPPPPDWDGVYNLESK